MKWLYVIWFLLVDIAPWLLDEKMLASVFRVELLPQTGDIPDLVLYRSNDGITPEQTVIRLRINGRAGSHVGTPAQ